MGIIFQETPPIPQKGNLSSQYRLRIGAENVRSIFVGSGSKSGGGANFCKRLTRLLLIITIEFKYHGARNLLDRQIGPTLVQCQVYLLLSLICMGFEMVFDPGLSPLRRGFVDPMRATLKSTGPEVPRSLWF